MPANDVEFSAVVRDGRTEITVEGTQAAVVVVESASGERIYLPPDDFQESEELETSGSEDSPYQSARRASPYQSSRGGDSPYEGASDPSDRQQLGLRPTPTGVRIVHPEPVDNVELFS